MSERFGWSSDRRRSRVREGLWWALVALLTTGVVGAAGAETVLVDRSSATFAWEPASGDVEYYEVYVARTTTGGQPVMEQTVAGGPSPSVTIDGAAGEILSVSVVAANAAETGPSSPSSDPVRFATSPPRPEIGETGVVGARIGAGSSGSFFYLEPSTGDLWRYEADAPQASPSHVAQEPDENWEVTASGDFDGDGEADLFWGNATESRTRMWLLRDEGYVEHPGPFYPGPGWAAETTGDFDGGGLDDVFWRSADKGLTQIWLSDGSAFVPIPYPTVPDPSWQLLAAGDFDADGLDDFFWRNEADSQTAIWFTTQHPSGSLLPYFALSDRQSLLYEVDDVFDRNGDGTDDLHWRTVATGEPAHWWLVDGPETEMFIE